jgi:hypothetical protein
MSRIDFKASQSLTATVMKLLQDVITNMNVEWLEKCIQNFGQETSMEEATHDT